MPCTSHKWCSYLYHTLHMPWGSSCFPLLKHISESFQITSSSTFLMLCVPCPFEGNECGSVLIIIVILFRGKIMPQMRTVRHTFTKGILFRLHNMIASQNKHRQIRREKIVITPPLLSCIRISKFSRKIRMDDMI